MAEAERKTQWLDYCHRLYETGEKILCEVDKLTIGSSLRDPKPLALALLCRTMSNFNGGVMLVEAGMIVNARTLVRSCFENLLWIAELASKRDEFVQEMVRDEVASQQGRGKMVLGWSDRLEAGVPYKEGLRDRLGKLAEKFPKAKSIRFSELGKDTGVNDSYMWFRQLSADAAHPSLTSLGRYFMKQPNNEVLISLEPKATLREEEDTLQYAAQALLGVCVATCEICVVPKVHATLSPFFDEFIALAKDR